VIDIRTFMLVLAIGNIGFAIVMSGYARHGADNPALRLWRWAKLVQGLAHLLIWLKPLYPSLLLDAVAASILVVGVMLEVAAYCSFFGFVRWRRVLYPACALALLVFHGARLGGAAAAYQNAMLSSVFALLTGSMAVLLLRQRSASLLQRIIGINDLCIALGLAARAYVSVGGELLPAGPGMVNSFTYLAGYLVMIVNSFGFLLLCKEKDDAKLAELATIDSLTGLLNRRAFFEHTERARLLALRQKQSVAMMMLDIDYFKRLNDRYGHAAGDEALCAFARTAQSILREHDILGRLGGEEFALLLPATDVVGAMQAAERLRAAVESAPVTVEGETLVLTVSIGVVMVDAAEHINQALARADHALYTAKSGGRNRVEVGLVKRRTCA
jgi:diguanylate cyclase (GGDEF)-like protein